MSQGSAWWQRSVLVGALGLGLFGTMLLPGADWPQWRGSNRDAVWNETGIQEKFPTGGLVIRWRAEVGFGYSSPVVAQGRVFVSDSKLDRPKATDRVHCFDESTGNRLWTYTHETSFPEWAFTANNEQGPNSTPVFQDGKLYAIGSLGHHLYCLNARTGDVAWQKDLEKEFEIPESANCAASPLIDGNLLILLVGGRPDLCVVALDKNSGREVWRALAEPPGHSSPIIITAGGVRQLIVWTQKSVSSLDPATGKVYWSESFPGAGTGAVSTPVLMNDRLLIGGLMLKLDTNKPAAEVLWPESQSASKRVLSGTSTALLRGGQVFSIRSSGEFVCLDSNTGKQLWGTNTVTDVTGAASVHITVNGESALLFNDRGELIRAQLTGQGYHEISRARLIEPTYPFGGRNVVWTPPAFANRHVFARSEKWLVCASLAKEPM